MDANASLGHGGAVTSQAQFQVARLGQMLKQQQAVRQDLGNAALTLIRASVVNPPAPRHDLDVIA